MHLPLGALLTPCAPCVAQVGGSLSNKNRPRESAPTINDGTGLRASVQAAAARPPPPWATDDDGVQGHGGQQPRGGYGVGERRRDYHVEMTREELLKEREERVAEEKELQKKLEAKLRRKQMQARSQLPPISL